MSFRLGSSSLVLALLALSVAGCQKKETPVALASASAAPPVALASAGGTPTPVALASASATPSASASAAPAPATDVTTIRIPLPREGYVAYLKIKHPNAQAADVLNREFKAAADKKVSEDKINSDPASRSRTESVGGFASEDVFWESLTDGSYREGARCSWWVTKNRVWSLAGARPVRIDLKTEMTGDWIPVVDASCQEQFAGSRDPWTTFDEMFYINDDQPNWYPEKDGLVLTSAQTGSCDPDRERNCKVPWDRLASFVKPGSPLKPIADKAPPGPKPKALEDLAPPPPPELPSWRPAPANTPEQKACDGGDQRMCVKIAEELHQGSSPETARVMFWKACEAGEPTGCVNLGWSYLNIPEPNVAAGKAAAPYFGKACNDKVVIGCLGLGTIYRDGRSTSKNPGRAAELFKKACDGGVKPACAMAKATK